MSVRSSACVSAAPTRRISVKLDIGNFHENLSNKSKFCLNSANISGNYTWRPKYVLLLAATLNLLKSAHLEWFGVLLLLGYRRKHKHYTNTPQCYITRTLPILLFSGRILWSIFFFFFFFFFFWKILNFKIRLSVILRVSTESVSYFGH
jgi:hypothetical protein